eukprot:CAMPEP_0204639286 /NCGR_PEP_ID=MMETSP0717-20131115/42390_1 /ASSEMBLY_ACC=CAM_ASM_000666 /TAXON_ID=230516 /ORGANISM="Chaetoceros curvisetus" /LENGTH=579 /DNA_ID=CAMNT_0051659327 /DNA_START=11 /DNA_END=1747 /DNA_ORIENTATION=-
MSPTDIQVSITDPIHEHADADGHVHMNGDEHAVADPATSNNMGYSNTILLHNNRPPLTPTSLSSSLSASNNINISRKKRFKKRLRLRKMFRKSSSKSKVSGTGTAGTNTETNSSSSFNGTYDHQSQSASELSTQNSILSLGTISMMSQTELDDAQYDYDEAFHSHISSPIGMYTTYPLEETDEGTGTGIMREKNRKGNIDNKDGKKGKDSIDANVTTAVKRSTSTNTSTTDKQSSKLRWRKSAPSAANAIDSVSNDVDAPPPPPSPISTSSPNSSAPKYVGRRHTLEHITDAMKKSVNLTSRPCVSPAHIRSQSPTTDNHDHDAPFHPMMSLSLSPSADSNDDASTSTNNSNSNGNFNCTSNRLSYLYTLGKKLRSQGLYDKAKAAYTEALNILHNANVNVNANASASTPSSSSPSSYTTQKAMIRYELAKLKFAQYMEENGNDHHTEESRQTLSRLMQHVEIMRCKVSLQNLEFYQGQLHNMDTRVEKEDFRLDYHQVMERLNILHTLGKLCEKDLHRYEDALVYYQRALNIEEQMRNSWRKQMAKAKTKTKENQGSNSGVVDDGRSVQATEVELKEW